MYNASPAPASATSPIAPTEPKLLDQVRARIRTLHYSIHTTEEAYTGWMRRFILFHGKRHPRGMGASKS